MRKVTSIPIFIYLIEAEAAQVIMIVKQLSVPPYRCRYFPRITQRTGSINTVCLLSLTCPINQLYACKFILLFTKRTALIKEELWHFPSDQYSTNVCVFIPKCSSFYLYVEGNLKRKASWWNISIKELKFFFQNLSTPEATIKRKLLQGTLTKVEGLQYD